MTDPMMYIKKMGNALLLDKLSDILMILRVSFRRGRDHMIQDNDDFLGTFDPFDRQFAEFLDDGSGIIM